jgi:DNA-binding response OmpR family regulator
MHILLVDDEKEFVVTVAERLDLRGIDADWATSAEDALEMARRKHYDLAVLDVKLPRTSGLELRDQLAQDNPEMKFIFLTGHGSAEDYRTGTAGAAHYLGKPVSLQVLIEKMRETLAAEED